VKDCRFLELYQIKEPTADGFRTINSFRCKLGHEIPLSGCPENCPDYEPQMPDHHHPPMPPR